MRQSRFTLTLRALRYWVRYGTTRVVRVYSPDETVILPVEEFLDYNVVRFFDEPPYQTVRQFGELHVSGEPLGCTHYPLTVFVHEVDMEERTVDTGLAGRATRYETDLEQMERRQMYDFIKDGEAWENADNCPEQEVYLGAYLDMAERYGYREELEDRWLS